MKRSFRFMIVALIAMLSLSLGLSASAQDGKILVIGWEQEPPLLTPRSDLAFASMLTNFYSRDVWNWDTDRNIYPVMVAEVPSTENGLVEILEAGNTKVTYKLREGMLWSDGEAITSADCSFWHGLMMDPTTGTFQRGSYPEVVESFDVVDDLTFSITYNSPYPDYLTQNTATCGYPAHILAPILEADGTIDNAAYFTPDGVGAGATVGYGPYVIKSWTVGDSIVFEANPNWDGQAPAFTTVITKFVLDSAQMQNALAAGEIDVAFNFSDDFVEGYQAIEGTEVFGTQGVFGDAIWMNYGNNKGPVASAMADVNVRTALIAGLDRATLAEQLIGPGTGVPKAWHPEAFWPEDLESVSYDPDLANSLLDAAGWVDSDGDGLRDKDGTALVLRFFTTDRQIRKDYQIAIAEAWTAIGVGTQLLPVPASILFAGYLERGILSTGDFDIAIFALSASALTPYADAPDWFGCDGIPSAEDPNGSNGWGSCVPEFDAADKLVGVTVDPAERLAIAQDGIKAFVGAQFWHGLYLRQTWYAMNTAVLDPATAKDVGTLSSNYFNRIEYWMPAS